MINASKNEGFVVIIAACITLVGVGITAGVTYYCHTQNAKIEYERLEDKASSVEAQVNGTFEKDEHYTFVALVEDIKATPENILSENTSIQVPVSRIKHFLYELGREKISAIFTRFYSDESDQMQEETVRCPSWPFKENLKFIAHVVGNHLVCNITV